MWEFVTATENLPFSVSLAVMLALAMLEGVGMLVGAGLFSFIDNLLPDIDIDADLPDVESPGVVSQVLGWFLIGKVPFVVVFIVLLTTFGIAGYIVQSSVQSLTGSLIPALLASPMAMLMALPATRLSVAGIARIMPRDETEAVSSDSFVGRVAVITTGNARAGYAAQARLRDEHGQTHYVMVEPDSAKEQLPQGSEVLLIKKQGVHFTAIINPNPVLVDK
jgi:hypothetical protein